MIDLPDVNVWFPLVQPQHVNHGRSLRYWTKEASPQVAFCQITAHGLLRALSNQKAAASEALTVQEAWQQYQSLRELQEVIYATETITSDAFLEQWIDEAAFLPRLWTDAQLAALARAYEFRFVTFDRDFRKFSGLNVLLLEQEPAPPDGSKS